jgi:L-arabinose isomerase
VKPTSRQSGRPKTIITQKTLKLNEKSKHKSWVFGVGLDTYWAQFEGLLDHLKKYQEQIKTNIEQFGVQVIDGGMVDNPMKAREVADLFRTSDIEILFLYVF